jgi:DNA-binding transcriptional ArsR family regulator/uncharacterized protein YndB with AHSA1/START domain
MADDQLLSAVLEPRRRAILRVLEEEGGLAVGRLATHFDVSRPAISQHLAVLKDAGLVEMRSEKGRNTYSIVPARVAAARTAIAGLVADLPGGADDAPSPEPEAPATPSGPPPDVALEAFAAASPERVFAVASTVAGQALWLGQAEADASPGGRFHVDLGGDAAAGTYAVVEAPSRLAFGWGQEGNAAMAPDSSRVDLVFTASGDGTLIRLEHRGLPAIMHAPHLASWAHHLPRLAEAATAS